MTNQPPMSGTAVEISQGDAVEIAARKVGVRPEDLSVICQDDEAAPFKIYNAPTEPCEHGHPQRCKTACFWSFWVMFEA